MKMGKLIICLLFGLCLCACSPRGQDPSAAMGEVLVACALPSGTVYTLGEETGVALDEDLEEVLFGKDTLDGVRRGALYLSAREKLCEAAIFECYSVTEAKKLAELCLRRGEWLGQYEPAVTTGVCLRGRWVLWAAAESHESLLGALSRAVK